MAIRCRPAAEHSYDRALDDLMICGTESLPGVAGRKDRLDRMEAIYLANYRWVFCVILLTLFACGIAQGQSSATAVEGTSVRALPLDGGNLTVSEAISEDYLLLALKPPVHNWFAGSFTGLPVGRPVTFGLSMKGNDTSHNPADVAKWQGLAPVMSYADPRHYASFEWFHKNAEGRWISGDPLKDDRTRDAGNGPLPQQDAMPPELARGFLSADGRDWTPWREVDGTQVLTGANIFRITQAFQSPTATVAMRIPFTYTFLQSFITGLAAAKSPGVFIDDVGTTHEGRKLQVIRLEDPDLHVGKTPHRTILITAREHATECAGSWVLFGALAALLRQTPESARLRANTTWLFIPIQDPDGSADAVFDRLADLFSLAPDDPATPPDILAYARYISGYFYTGHNIHIAVTLHNLEAREGEQICCPFVDQRHAEMAIDFNQLLYQTLTAQGYRTGIATLPWARGFSPFRLFGWCAEQFGTVDFAFEVNDRFPDDRLSLPRLQGMGATLADSLVRWLGTTAGQRGFTRTEQLAKLKRLERAVYYDQLTLRGIDRSKNDLVSKAF